MSDTTTPIIVVEDLHASYGALKAVDGVSFRIASGECFGLLGPNGAGKTTTLACIEGIKAFDRGTIRVGGVDIREALNRVKRMLGVQLQESSLFPDLTMVEIIQFYSVLYQTFLSRAQAVGLLERFELADKAGSRVEQLSGGQQQRLTLALALAHDPPILVLDEPTTGLDPQARRNIWDIVHRLRDEGKTIILTTHYMEEAEVLCQRVGIIDQGRILALDTPSNLIKTMGDISTVMARTTLPEIKVRELEQTIPVRSISYNPPDLILQTSQPQQALNLLQAMSDSNGGMFGEVVIRRPNLEDVFLSLTGHALRKE